MSSGSLTTFRAAVLADVRTRAHTHAAGWSAQHAAPAEPPDQPSELEPSASVHFAGQSSGWATENGLAALQERGYADPVLRYAALTAPPTAPWRLSWATLEAARCARETLLAQVQRLASAEPPAELALTPSLEAQRDRFAVALLERLDTPAALEVIWEIAHGEQAATARCRLLLELDQVLDLGLQASVTPPEEALPPEAAAMIDARAEARRQRDWARSDALRDQLAELNVEAQDGPAGSVYRRVRSQA